MSNIDALQILATCLLAVVGYLAKCRIEKAESELTAVQHEIKEIKGNYLTRFEAVNKNISDSKMEIIKEIHKIEMKEK